MEIGIGALTYVISMAVFISIVVNLTKDIKNHLSRIMYGTIGVVAAHLISTFLALVVSLP